MTPTECTIKRLRKEGYTTAIVEKWIPKTKRRKDLYGCIDITAIRSNQSGVFGIQATSRGHVSDRVKKALAIPALKIWLQAGNRFEVWGWKKKGARYQVVKRKFYLEDDDIMVLKVKEAT